ncbi:hypothetical protein P792_07855 [Asaia sp. SF2.1]|nr:hypothetical protein P792_07855 [Asaia sp. SF2.1]
MWPALLTCLTVSTRQDAKSVAGLPPKTGHMLADRPPALLEAV